MPSGLVSIRIRLCDAASDLLSKLHAGVAEAPSSLHGTHICLRLASTLQLPKHGVAKVLPALLQQLLSGVQDEPLQQFVPGS